MFTLTLNQISKIKTISTKNYDKEKKNKGLKEKYNP